MTPPIASVVTVGSLHYDIFVEAPHRPAAGETVTGHRWFPKLGGKGGNQAIAAALCGVPSVLVSAVGRDGFAPLILDALAVAGVDAARVARVDAGTGMSVAISDASGDYGAIIVSGANLEIDAAELESEDLWRSASHLMLQNEVPEKLNVAAARAARAHGVAVCLNAAPWRKTGRGLFDLVDLLVVNALEAEALCGVAVEGLETAAEAAEALSRRFASVVVTAGGHGVAFASGARRVALPAERVAPVSTHGAGDRFIGTLVGRLAVGDGEEDALRLANLAAARHVSSPHG